MTNAAVQRVSENVIPAIGSLRVLHVHAGNMFGGIERMLLTHVEQGTLHPGIESSFALCFVGPFSAQLQEAGAKVHDLGAVRISRVLSVQKARRRLTELLRREQFDVAVTHSAWSQAIFGRIAQKENLPLVSYVHAPTNEQNWLARWAQRTRPDAVICNSRFTASATAINPRTLKPVVIYCPVAAPPRIGEKDRRAIRKTVETPAEATVILQVSRMEPWKGQRLHLEALALIRDVDNWVCWFVGGAQTRNETKYVDELKIQAKRLGLEDRVRYLGQRSDVQNLLEAADIFCQPNTGPEPFGISFIEALNARLPVVATNLGGAREIVDDSVGMLVPPEPEAVSLSLRRLICDENLRTRLGNGGPARARELCDPGTQMKQFGELLTRVIGMKHLSL
jgi:glycosyltransferase involved in cell wall biosynthesis